MVTLIGAMAEPVLTNWIGKLLLLLYNNIGNFGWTVIVFSILLKLVLTPIDIWQRHSMRKQRLALAALQPKMEKLQKQYANRPDILKQKQYELQRASGMNIFSTCLPLIVTMAVFFIVFAGFRSLVEYQNQLILFNLNKIYVENSHLAPEALNKLLAEAYKPEGWLWVKNVFMSDIGTNVIPSYNNFVSSGFGGINADIPDGLTATYEELVGPAIDLYNKKSFWDIKNWNGYFVLPILSIATSFISTKLMQRDQPQTSAGTPEQQAKQKTTMKMMNYMMPLMLGVFAILYSAAFAIYYFMSNILSVFSTMIYNAIMKGIDKKKAETPTL